MNTLQGREEFPALLNQLGLTGTAIEVGVWHGDHARQILQNWEGEKLILIDPYQAPGDVTEWGKVHPQADFDEAKEAALQVVNAFPGRCEIYFFTSQEASSQFFGQYDLIYLDGSHRYPDIHNDLRAWWPRVKEGGIFAGHDFINAKGRPGDGRPIPVTSVYDADEALELDFAVEFAVREFLKEIGREADLQVTQEAKVDYRSWWLRK
jgi:hypothetical protein